jgi:hypothetical protein
MTISAKVISRPVWRARMAAAAPRLVFIALMAVLVLAGLRTLVGGPARIVEAQHPKPERDLAAETFAERFARAYLTWDASRPQIHERAVSEFTSDALEPGAGLQLPRQGAQTVVWTASVRDEALPRGLRLVTVAAETTNSPYFLTNAVQRDSRGFMAISRYPALVGAPPVATNLAPPEEPVLEDAQLEGVVRRAISNYLKREAANLRADLDQRSSVALPPTPLRVSSIDTPAWVGPGRVAVQVRAEARGATWTLSYELGIVKRDRWYVRSIASDQSRPG